MHILNDSFIKPHGEVQLKGQSFFRFEIFYHNIARDYFVENEDDYIEWITQIRIATGSFEIFQIYEIIGTIKSCAASQILKAKSRDSDRVYCIKSICKMGMSMKDLEDIKIEAEVMKVCQHPNIVKLFDVYDSLENTYLGKHLFKI